MLLELPYYTNRKYKVTYILYYANNLYVLGVFLRLTVLFLLSDFKQIELRLLADMSKDHNLLAIFKQTNNKDIFIQLASQWYVGQLSSC